MTKPVLRIGVLNNFNFTDAEIAAVLQWQNKGYLTFVNSNSFTPVRAEAGAAVITVNPYLDMFVEPRGDLTHVKAVRVKFVANPVPAVSAAWDQSLQWADDHGIPVLVTVQRFARRATMQLYCQDPTAYVQKNGYFRLLLQPAFAGLEVCDKEQGGCPACGRCARLTHGSTAEVAGLNLQESGVCQYNCPDCFAKKLLMGRAPSMGKVFQNRKQKGQLKH